MGATWLVAHDFSPCADAAALEAASDLAESGGRLVLLHVVSTKPGPVGLEWLGGGTSVETWRNLQCSLLGRAEAALRKRVEHLLHMFPGVKVEVIIREGLPDEAILAAVEELGATRVVVGTHGRTGLKHLLLGSVAERVARMARVPVLVVKARPGTAVPDTDDAGQPEEAAGG